MTGDLESRKRFEPAEAEPRITTAWHESGLFHPDAEGSAEQNYSIAIPPPNVTGALHMGHALNGSIQDTLIRYHRMHGRRTKWILGTDHAGIATQTQVEKQLVAEGLSREGVGREEFVRRVWLWREQYGSTIVDQFKRLGASCDYEDERFTLDEDYVEAVLRVFVELYDAGLIYRDNYLVNWDPGSRSAISDLEVEDRETTDSLFEIAYPLADGDGEIVVATVRPETMLADTAVAVHPDDERYAQFVGREVILPLVGRRLPVIADEYVKRDFGTGALKITPGHDPNDFEIGRRHRLAEINVIGEDGRMTATAGKPYAGMTVAEAQVAVVAALEAEGALRKREPYTHQVPFSQRSGQRIEPLVSLQWFMKMDELAQPAIDAVVNGDVRIQPEGQQRRYLAWLSEIRPWCISRQLWWGHRLPVYYCVDCDETHVAMSEPEACSACGGKLRRDEDVLDTWFSSALWPFATLGWPDQTAALQAFYPTDVLTTARDIIFLWVARMVMMGLRFTGRAPFSDVYVHSVIQAPDGRRMSKSLGTGIDPLQLIDGGPRPPVFREGGDFPAYGADAVRFGLLAMSSTQDVRFSEEKVAQGRALGQKLFSAARFALLSVDVNTAPAPRPTSIEDRWILSRLTRAELLIAKQIEAFDFAHASLALYDFVFSELCDWYIELVKGRLADGGEELTATLLYVLRRTVALAHPLIPFVTEEVWSFLQRDGEGLLAGLQVSAPDESLLDEQAEVALAQAIAAIQEMRAWRDSVGIGPGMPIAARLKAEGYEQTAPLLARIARLEFNDGGEAVETVAISGGTIEIFAGEGVDFSARDERLAKQRERLAGEIARVEGKLSNQAFVAKAPDAVVAAEREKLARLQAEHDAL